MTLGVSDGEGTVGVTLGLMLGLTLVLIVTLGDEEGLGDEDVEGMGTCVAEAVWPAMAGATVQGPVPGRHRKVAKAAVSAELGDEAP